MSDAVRDRLYRLASSVLVVLAGCQFDGSALDDRPPCLDNDDCAAPLRCVAGSCSPTAADDGGVDLDAATDVVDDGGLDDARDATADTSPTECEPGTAVCVGQTATFCNANGTIESEINCSAAASCPGVELGCACSEGACLPRVCRAGTRACDGDNVTLCSNDGLVATIVESCDDTERACIGGGCVVTECTGSETRCSGTAVVECRDNTLVEIVDCVETEQRCVEDGDGATCAERVCEPGGIYCNETRTALLFCNDDGSAFGRTEACGSSAYCSIASGEAACVAEACDPGSRRCAPSTEAVETCAPLGDTWTVSTTCDSDEICSDGACVPQACVPLSASCVDLDTRSVCDARGASTTDADCTFDRHCIGGVCAADVCSPDALRCATGRSREVCDAFGSAWQPASACAESTACIEGDCVPLVCAPNSTRCEDNSVVTCNATGTATSSADCDPAQTCVDGQCIEPICSPGALSCGPGQEVLQCNSEGTATTTVEVCPFGCSAGVCQAARCGDGVVSAGRGETCDDGNTTFCDGCESCQRRGALVIGPATQTTTTRAHNVGTGDFTIEAWVNVSGNDGTIAAVSAAPGGPGDFAAIGVSAGRPYFEFGLGTGSAPVRAEAPTAIRGTGWHHVAGVRFARHWAVVFVDGSLAAYSHPSLSFTSCDTDRFFIGATAGLGFVGVDALIDEVRFVTRREYAREFTPARRLETTDASTIALYGFDDESAVAIDDRSAAGNDLVLTGATWIADACYGAPPTSIACGDGERAPWEACDDDNFIGGDGCSPSCLRESTCTGAGRTIGARGECYVLHSTAANWNAARNACSGASATLVTIEDEYEQAFLRSFVAAGTTTAWIGLNDRDNEGTFVWTSGSASAFRFWTGGEPNNFANEDCVQIAGNEAGTWNDFGCDSSLAYICESRAF